MSRDTSAHTEPMGRPTGDGPASLPHDRDEKPVEPKDDAQHRANRAPVEQARRDVESGVQDTERIGVPSDVPASDENKR